MANLFEAQSNPSHLVQGLMHQAILTDLNTSAHNLQCLVQECVISPVMHYVLMYLEEQEHSINYTNVTPSCRA